MSENENEAEALAKRLSTRKLNQPDDAVRLRFEAASLLRSQAERIAEMEKALEPFADALAGWEAKGTQRMMARYDEHDFTIFVQHLLNARTALRGEKEKVDG